MVGFEEVCWALYTAKEAAELTGLTTAALRYYEKERLLPAICRSEQAYRQYSDSDIEWINMVRCLRDAGVSIRAVREYVQLLAQGGATMAERRQMVEQYIREMRKKIEMLQTAINLAQRKLMFYDKHSDMPGTAQLTWQKEWELFRDEGRV